VKRERRRGRAIERLAAEDVDRLRQDLERRVGEATPPRWGVDPKDVERSVVRLVLTLVEFLRRLLERQALRRMEGGTLTPREIEAIGTALLRLEETVAELAARFGLDAAELNLDLGPLGRLL
jgi:hypothetical protein